MADDNFDFVSEKVVKRTVKDAPPNLLSTSSQTSQASFRSDAAASINSVCFGLFLNSKSISTKNYVLTCICFLAILLVSFSILAVTSYSSPLGLDENLHRFHKTSAVLDANHAEAAKLPDDGVDRFFQPESSTDSELGSLRDLNSDSRSLKISENGRVAFDSSGKITAASCTVEHATLKIYMYDLPSEFHFGMITQLSENSSWPKDNEIPRYPGGLNQQHSPEYWLTADLLTSSPDRRNPCVAVRVQEHSLADAYFVPFFSSLSYNKYSRAGHKAPVDQNVILQKRLMDFLLKQESWNASEGRNHIIPMHHPNSLHFTRQHLQNAIFVVADFGRYSKQVANLAKDIVAPYKHIVPYFDNDNTSFDSRSILLFFQGAIIRKEGGAIRQNLHELLKEEAGVHFTTGSTQSSGVRSATRGMRSSKFCLHLAGDTPSSNRLFDAIASHCVPVIISDEIELPFEDQLDYSEFCVFIRSSDALKKGFLIKLLKSIKRTEWTSMWHKLHQVGRHFEFQHPSQLDDAVHMTWKAVARKLSYVKLLLHKNKRYWRSDLLH